MTSSATATRIRPIEHGSVRGYRAGCRGECCREAARRREATYRIYKARPKFEHGTVTGYYNHCCRCGKCKAAGSAYQAEYRRTHPRGQQVPPAPAIQAGRLPIEPLDAILKARGTSWHQVGVSGGSVNNWRRNGLPILVADFVACRLGHHPGEVWPEWWQL
jgi:hypothetical protein